jgi:hypothetical protein
MLSVAPSTGIRICSRSKPPATHERVASEWPRMLGAGPVRPLPCKAPQRGPRGQHIGNSTWEGNNMRFRWGPHLRQGVACLYLGGAGAPRYYRIPPTASAPRHGAAAPCRRAAPQRGAATRCRGIALRPGTTAYRLPRPRGMRYRAALALLVVV